MSEPEKKIPSYSPEQLGLAKKQALQRPNVREEVFGGQFIPKEVARKMLRDFVLIHNKFEKEQQKHIPCEALWVHSFLSLMEAMGFPPMVGEDVVNEWMIQIRQNPPDFFKTEK